MATTKKRAEGDDKRNDTAPKKERPAKTAAGASRKATAVAAAKGSARPRLRASHSAGAAKPRPKRTEGALARRSRIAPPPEKAPRAPVSKRTPVGAPKRAQRPQKRDSAPPSPSDKAQQLAVSIAVAGLDKKALAIEILDVTGKVDYADFLVVMTGRSDRHVHSIATGIEEALARKNKVKPLSVEGLSTATWVLIDFGDVVVHVFQEDSRKLYDIEGLWIDAGRVPLPENEQKAAAQLDESDGL